MIGAARKPETQVPHPTPPGRHPEGTPPKNMSHGPVASGPNSVPNTTRRYRSGSVPGPPPFSEEKGKGVRTNNRPVPPGTYPLIFHPWAPAAEQSSAQRAFTPDKPPHPAYTEWSVRRCSL